MGYLGDTDWKKKTVMFGRFSRHGVRNEKTRFYFFYFFAFNTMHG